MVRWSGGWCRLVSIGVDLSVRRSVGPSSAQEHPVPAAFRDELIVPSLDAAVESSTLAMDFIVDPAGALGQPTA